MSSTDEFQPTDVFPMDLRAAIRHQRELKGLTLADLSRLTGASRITLAKLEHGGDVRLSTFTAVLGVLGISFKYAAEIPFDRVPEGITEPRARKRTCILADEMKDGWF